VHFDDGMSLPFLDVTQRCWKEPNSSGARSCDGTRPLTIAVDFQGDRQQWPLSTIRELEVVSSQMGHGWQNGAMGFLESAELRVTSRTGAVAAARLTGLVSYAFRVRDTRTGEVREEEVPWVLVGRNGPALNMMRIEFDGP
jgi:hypothetical protein